MFQLPFVAKTLPLPCVFQLPAAVRHYLCLAFPPPSWLRHCLCLVFPLPAAVRHHCACAPPSWLRHCLCRCGPQVLPGEDQVPLRLLPALRRVLQDGRRGDRTDVAQRGLYVHLVSMSHCLLQSLCVCAHCLSSKAFWRTKGSDATLRPLAVPFLVVLQCLSPLRPCLCLVVPHRFMSLDGMPMSTNTAVRRLSLTFHCLSLIFHRLSLTFHRLSLTFHRLSLTFHRLSLTFSPPFLDLSLPFPGPGPVPGQDGQALLPDVRQPRGGARPGPARDEHLRPVRAPPPQPVAACRCPPSGFQSRHTDTSTVRGGLRSQGDQGRRRCGQVRSLPDLDQEGCKTPPLPRVPTVFVAKTPPLPCVSTAFAAKTLPLSCVPPPSCLVFPLPSRLRQRLLPCGVLHRRSSSG